METRKKKPLPKHLTAMKKRPSFVWRNKDVSYHNKGCTCPLCTRIRQEAIKPEHLQILTFPTGSIEGIEPLPERGERQEPPKRKLGAEGFMKEKIVHKGAVVKF